MLHFSRIPNAMYSSSQHFQLVYFCRFATFSKARHAVIYSVGSLDVLQTYKACRSLRSWASKNEVRTCSSCTSMLRFRCLNMSKQSFLQTGATHLHYKWRGVAGGAAPPHWLLDRSWLFCFASCLHYEIAGGLGGRRTPPLPICKTWTKIRTHISLAPL